MSRRQRRRILLSAIGALGTLALAGARARGDVLYWDGNGAAAPNPAGGAGTWSAVSSNWWNGSATQAYDTGLQPHDVVFGAAAGSVTASGVVTARSLTFNTSGYTLAGGAITLADAGLVSVTEATDTATVSSVVSGTTLTKTGAGTLVLSGTNTYAGLNVLGGVVSFSSGAHLGDANQPVNLDGGTLRFTGSSSLATPATRGFVVGPRGATFDITNTSGTGLTVGGVLSGAGPLVKTGNGTLRLDSAGHVFAGGVTIEGGTFRFNNNNQAGPTALRANHMNFDPAAGNVATLSLGGNGGSTTGEGAELRTGEWNYAGLAGAASVVAATTTTDPAVGAHGHDLMIFALADGSYAGSLNNTITASGGVAGTNSTHGELQVRGIATQTLRGATNVNNTITVTGPAAGLRLSGSAALTGAGVNLQLKGGTLTLDNLAGSNANRFNDAAVIETRGGGSVALAANAAGSTETLGPLQMGTATAARSGQVNIRIETGPNASAASILTLASLQRDSGRATVDFQATTVNVANGAIVPVELGQAGSNPRIMFAATPTMAAGGLLSAGGVGFATVNGSDFATYGANGIAPVATTPFASAGVSDNALLTGSAAISSTKSIASLKFAPTAPGQSLLLSDTADLDTSAILHTGPFAFTVAGSGTGGLTGATTRHVFVQHAHLTISASVTGDAPLVKSGDGTLVLTAANTYTGPTTVNAGSLRIASNASLGSGTLELRGGVLEIAGGGTFNRHLDQGQGSAGSPGLISWNAVGPALGQTSETDRGSGGFAAVGANAVVDLNGLGPTDINWEEPSFLSSGYALIMGSKDATARVDLIDNYGFGLAVDSYNAREIRVLDNPASTLDVARISGIIYSDTPANGGRLHDLVKSGPGVLELAGNNTYYGGTIIAEGTIVAAHDNALGHASAPYVLLGNRGGSGPASLLARTGVTLARDITAQAGGSGVVTLGADGSSGAATFAGVISVQRNLALTAAAGSTAHFTGAIENATGCQLTKSGGGTVTMAGAQAHGPGATLTVTDGTMNLNSDAGGNLTVHANSTINFGSSQQLAGLHVSGAATATVLADGAAKILASDALTISGTARLDLKDNALVTLKPIGTFTGDVYVGVQGDVQRAYSFGAWDQPGLTTSMPEAGQNAGPLSNTTTIGVATAEQVMFIGPSDTGVFQGQTVTGATTIAMYTYAGDLNLDGLVDGADYGVIDNSVQFPSTDGYVNGDFNYDGVIDGADYGIIDNTIQLQGAPFPGVVFGASASASALLPGVTAVPEPATLSVTVLLAAALLTRRPRRLKTHGEREESHARSGAR